MDHWFGHLSHFDFSFLVESIEFNGATFPFYAMLDQRRHASTLKTSSELRQPGLHIVLPPAGQPAWTGSFAFFSSSKRYVMKRGYTSEWITLPAPVEK